MLFYNQFKNQTDLNNFLTVFKNDAASLTMPSGYTANYTLAGEPLRNYYFYFYKYI